MSELKSDSAMIAKSKMVTGKDLFEQLQQVIHLPEHCRRLHIELAFNSAPVVTAEFLASAKDGVITKRFELKEVH